MTNAEAYARGGKKVFCAANVTRPPTIATTKALIGFMGISVDSESRRNRHASTRVAA
jgi:hypothetical protein